MTTPGRPAIRPVQGPKNAYRIPLPGEAVLVERPDEAQVLTERVELDAHTALFRGLAEYLGSRTMTIGKNEVRFAAAFYDMAEPDDRKLSPSFNLYGTARGEYEAGSTTPQIVKTPVNGILRFVTPAEYVQSIGIQIFATTPHERGNAAALVEQSLFPVDWMAGFRLRLPYYFGAYADYQVSSNEFIDTEEAATKHDRQAAFIVTGRLLVLRLKPIPLGKPRFQATVDDIEGS